MDKTISRDPDRAPTHPGAMLREIVIPSLHRNKTEIARALGVSRETLHKLLNERQRVTPELAAKLGAAFGNGPGLWLRMQAAVDTHYAEHLDVSEVRDLTPG
jgi:addiction module HigA family antidote